MSEEQPRPPMLLLMLAMSVCCNAHADQYDFTGRPYAEHPMRLAARIPEDDTDAKIVALLHDVIEDTPITIGKLDEMGFTQKQTDAITILTRQEGEDYEDYVRQVATNPLAKRIKLLDLEDNMDLSRLTQPLDERDITRTRKYHKAYLFLNQFKGVRTVSKEKQAWKPKLPKPIRASKTIIES